MAGSGQPLRLDDLGAIRGRRHSRPQVVDRSASVRGGLGADRHHLRPALCTVLPTSAVRAGQDAAPRAAASN